MLLRDLANVSVRKRYLAARTPALKQRDRDSQPMNLELILQIVSGSIGVAVIVPLALLFAFAFFVGLAFLRSRDPMAGGGAEQLGRLFGHGLFIAVVLGFLSGFFVLIYLGIVSARMRYRCEELGPLPHDAPANPRPYPRSRALLPIARPPKLCSTMSVAAEQPAHPDVAELVQQDR